ncbi:unnamed protein product [Polarella glacialis]|uniref:Uncharacterized protein n=1 Tax=Polarella glacialis TaxID=89957 RepID=A0A813K0C5_POLGL|nr:unnamed protein product [Polarella glacialis]CAE8688508.1 unnamed protein product [Polarella glacialis]
MFVPSSWPMRNEHRHVAVARDFNILISRLDNRESAIAVMTSKLENLHHELLPKINASDECKDIPCLSRQVHDVSGRIDRMEFLLFRSSLQDFAKLDEEITALLPRLQDQLLQERPDFEPSPERPSTLRSDPPGLEVPADANPKMCLRSDISDDAVSDLDGESGGSNSVPDEFGSFQRVLESLVAFQGSPSVSDYPCVGETWKFNRQDSSSEVFLDGHGRNGAVGFAIQVDARTGITGRSRY